MAYNAKRPYGATHAPHSAGTKLNNANGLNRQHGNPVPHEDKRGTFTPNTRGPKPAGC